MCNPLNDNSLKKHERINSSSDINRLFERGESFYEKPFVIYFLTNENPKKTPIRILISVPKKKISKAVNRNLIKRRIREAFRKNKHSISEFCRQKQIAVDIAIIYSQNTIEEYNNIEKKIVLSLQSLEQKL